MRQYQENSANLLRRLRRVEGQVRGIQRMIEEGRYCVDILIQIAAARSALDGIGMVLLEDHVRGCVTSAIREDKGQEAVDELLDVIERFTK